jgi:hypothetical protein
VHEAQLTYVHTHLAFFAREEEENQRCHAGVEGMRKTICTSNNYDLVHVFMPGKSDKYVRGNHLKFIQTLQPKGSLSRHSRVNQLMLSLGRLGSA